MALPAVGVLERLRSGRPACSPIGAVFSYDTSISDHSKTIRILGVDVNHALRGARRAAEAGGSRTIKLGKFNNPRGGAVRQTNARHNCKCRLRECRSRLRDRSEVLLKQCGPLLSAVHDGNKVIQLAERLMSALLRDGRPATGQLEIDAQRTGAVRAMQPHQHLWLAVVNLVMLEALEVVVEREQRLDDAIADRDRRTFAAALRQQTHAFAQESRAQNRVRARRPHGRHGLAESSPGRDKTK